MLYIAPAIRTKLLYKHDVREHEIEEAFANREGGFLEDERAEHITIPPTQWFIAETNHGRRLKIVFIADSGRADHQERLRAKQRRNTHLPQIRRNPMKPDYYHDTDQWEARELGASEAYVKPSTLDGKAVDETLGLKAISIRLQTSMIDDLKAIAARDGIGYQPLIKRVLARFIEEEQGKPHPEMAAMESTE